MTPYILIAAFCALACISLLGIGIGHALKELREEDRAQVRAEHKAAAEKQAQEFLAEFAGSQIEAYRAEVHRIGARQ